MQDRSVVRHKSYGLARLTVAEAIADLELLDYDFHLFTDRSTNAESVIYRTDDGYRLVQVRPRPGAIGQVSDQVTMSEVPAPRLDLAEAETRLEEIGQPFVFFVNSETGRGNLIYHRYDGDYGLITPADA
jgi:hypothetical protein